MSYEDQDITKISNNLYISNWYTSINPIELKKYNIKAIITIETRQKTQDVLNYYRRNNIDYLFLYLNDLSSENISKYFDISYNFIDKHIKTDNNVLVNCYAGISRSSTIILNYIYRNNINKFSNSECVACRIKNIIEYMRTKRSIINPNPGFIQQIIQYYKHNN